METKKVLRQQRAMSRLVNALLDPNHLFKLPDGKEKAEQCLKDLEKKGVKL